MIKPPSIQAEYTLIYSGDPALNLPESDAARDHALKVMRETGEWKLVEGGQPTLFHLRPLTGTEFAWLQGEHARRDLADVELAALALRLALVRIDNFGDVKVKRTTNDDGITLASLDVINALYAVADEGRVIVGELGGLVFMRTAESPSPK